MALSALLFASFAAAPPKASAAVDIFLTLDGIPAPSHSSHLLPVGEVYNAVATAVSIALL
jgi:hypothetical protein